MTSQEALLRAVDELEEAMGASAPPTSKVRLAELRAALGAHLDASAAEQQSQYEAYLQSIHDLQVHQEQVVAALQARVDALSVNAAPAAAPAIPTA